MANIKISELPLGTPNVTSIFPFVDGGTTYQGAISAITSNSTVEIVYSELVDKINGNTLNTGSYYIITDFKTCYDRPDYDSNFNAITSGNYSEALVDPIIVFATSTNTISVDAYQPSYPNDKIKYDWTFSATEVTQGVAYGRISERIDEFNNRTDYDHRTIEFKRYRNYQISFESAKVGFVNVIAQSETEMVVTGTGTNFQSLSVNDIIGFTNTDYRVYQITNIISDTEMVITGLTYTDLNNVKVCPTDQLGYSSCRQNNISVNDFEIYFTFNYNVNFHFNSYIGNFSNLQQYDEETFILANNVFLSTTVNNVFGDNCYNNTFTDNVQNNQIGFSFNRNIIENSFYDNNIGNYFNSNKISASFNNNQVGQGFSSNYFIYYNCYQNVIGNNFSFNIVTNGNLLGNKIGNDTTYNKIYNQFNNNNVSNSFEGNEIYYSFYENTIGYAFSDNIIYSEFYSNQIGNNFGENIIGDDGNIGTFEFYRNRIGNSFNNNTVNRNFQNNQIGNQFNSNLVYGSFYKNVIGNGYNNNSTSTNFYGNHIGNGMYSNIVKNNSHSNKIGEYFNSNFISYDFQNNEIGNLFENNTLGNTDNFDWGNTSIENLTGRTYNTFYNSLDEGIDNNILGLDMIMHDTVNDEYHKVKFTQWTPWTQGGGFAYERTKVYPTVEPTVYFKKTNYGSEVDVIVEGSLEITRGNYGGIYNSAEEGSFDSNVSPLNTEWNSIYTQGNNGSGFQDNSIGNQFKGNLIFSYFDLNIINTYVGYNEFFGSVTGNKIGSYTFGNTFSGSVSVNSWDGDFYSNNINDGFQRNKLGDGINDNTIGINFQDNTIGSNFSNNIIRDNFGYGYSASQSNTVGNNFTNNNIGEYCYNNVFDDNFQYNTIGNYFQWNDIRALIQETNFYSCVLYSATTVNVFKNNGGDIKLSYFDESDVLNVESINENACVTFTIQSSDFTNGGSIYLNTTALGVNGVDGFENTAPDNLGVGYYGQNLGGESLSQLIGAYNQLGLSLSNSVGYIWNVSWGPDSTYPTGLVKFGSYVNTGLFDIQPIDTSNPNYLIPGYQGISLVGTFKFPATFTAYLPLVNKSGWC